MERVSFENQQLYVGIDVHKSQWTVSIFSGSLCLKTFSQSPNPSTLKSFIDKHYPGAKVKCAYESCKIGYWIYRELVALGYECLVVNPADIPSTHKESSEKTDPNDSRKIGKALRAGLLRGIHVPSEKYEGMRQLCRYRKHLWGDLVRVKNRIRDKLLCRGITPPEELKPQFWTKRFLDWLEKVELPTTEMRLALDLLLEQYHTVRKHLLRVEKELRNVMKQSAQKKKADLLGTIPGIGPLTTAQLISELGDIGRFENFKKLNGYVGFKPTSHSSGERDFRGRLTHRGHHSLRSALVECSWVSIRADPALSLYYEGQTKRMTGKRAIVKVARKLLGRIYYVLKNEQPYELGVIK